MDYKETETLGIEMAHSFYQGDRELLFERMHPDVVFLPTGRYHLVSGRKNLKRTLRRDKEPGIQYDIVGMNCKSYSITSNSCFTLLEMELVEYHPDGKVFRCNQRITAVWRYFQKLEIEPGIIKSGWFYLHFHISLATEAAEPQNKIQQMEENYMKDVLDYTKAVKKLGIKDREGRVYYVSENQIIRAQGQGASTLICLEKRDIVVYKMLGEVEKELGKKFLRIHKSHIINPTHVVSIKSYQVTLDNGAIVPISETKYQKVKKDIEKSLAVSRNRKKSW